MSQDLDNAAPDHDRVVQSQFGPQAQAYVASTVHASGDDLDWIARLAEESRATDALDLGCGGGHVAYRLAAHAARVTASDLSSEMLAAVTATAGERGLANIATQKAPAEALPFADGAFDFLACRFTAHHWRDFPGGLREARRVLAKGRPALFVDGIAAESALFDTHLQAVELLRDPSHVRDYRPSEWLAALGTAGFEVRSLRRWRLRMEFASWIARMRPPEIHAGAIRSLQQGAAQEIADYFAIEADGSFMLDVIGIEAV